MKVVISVEVELGNEIPRFAAETTAAAAAMECRRYYGMGSDGIWYVGTLRQLVIEGVLVAKKN